jgi:hypothetical protein
MSKKEYKKLAQQVAARETAFRDNLAGQSNMTASLAQYGAQTGAPGTINPQEIPSVAALANYQAIAQTASQQRQANMQTRRKELPSYVNSYRKYLKWRYPSRYGGGSGSSSGYSLPPYEIPDLPLPTLPEINR